ncbi:hypothetical protein GOP47_0015352 [Adiantum capillus-veneris]|uniref:Uncharacterized protein n=1 Tax=Adiantum capillus-veneris TaxID=13818 RepID=A0A9D4UJJ2_ADICA|nr:hypothetical protein GOP47_0015352 [Adiantum capillus-veneris]
MVREVRLQYSNRPLWAQAISLAAEVEDLEEEEFLLANPSVELVFDIDVMTVLGLKKISPKGELDQVLPGTVTTKGEFLVLEKKQLMEQEIIKEMEGAEAIVVAKQRFEEHMSKSARI